MWISKQMAKDLIERSMDQERRIKRLEVICLRQAIGEFTAKDTVNALRAEDVCPDVYSRARFLTIEEIVNETIKV